MAGRKRNLFVGTSETVQAFLIENGSTLLSAGASLAELIRRPELSYEVTAAIDPGRPFLPADTAQQVNIQLKYEGYISRQMKQAEQFKKLEKKIIPKEIDYDQVGSLRLEARQKLKKFRPENIGQASRIQGVSPADVSVLLVYIKSKNRGQTVG